MDTNNATLSAPTWRGLDNENGVEVLVYKLATGEFSVVVRDVDADQALPFVRKFSCRAEAVAHAQSLLASGQVGAVRV